MRDDLCPSLSCDATDKLDALLVAYRALVEAAKALREIFDPYAMPGYPNPLQVAEAFDDALIVLERAEKGGAA